MAESAKGNTFVSLRKEKNLTQRDIALALGISEDTVANWERGRSIPKLTIPQIKRLCSVLEKPIEQLPDSFISP
jgi:transcriptional regulator with XRE-family HTH domain